MGNPWGSGWGLVAPPGGRNKASFHDQFTRHSPLPLCMWYTYQTEKGDDLFLMDLFECVFVVCFEMNSRHLVMLAVRGLYVAVCRCACGLPHEPDGRLRSGYHYSMEPIYPALLLFLWDYDPGWSEVWNTRRVTTTRSSDLWRCRLYSCTGVPVKLLHVRETAKQSLCSYGIDVPQKSTIKGLGY